MSEATNEVIWLTRLLGELDERVEKPVLFVDSASAVKLAKNPEYHKRSKHVETRHFFVREKVLSGEIEVQHIEGENQLADAMTKALERERLPKLRRAIGMECPQAQEGVLKK